MRGLKTQSPAGTTGLLFGLLLAIAAQAARLPNMTSYLQGEVNEVALLTAQSNYLQQQGDPLGAALVASYIPDHQVMIRQWSTFIQQNGGNPSMVQPIMTPVQGTREQILRYDEQAHQQAIDSYRRLARSTSNPTIRGLAALGEGGATRHFNSLEVANSVSTWSTLRLADATMAALALERAAINDLQVQANQLTALGDPTTANLVMSMIPQHQQQAANLQALLVQLGGNPNRIILPPTVVLGSRTDILSHLAITNTQFVNTYAIAINALPPGPLQQVMAQGQSLALTALASLQQLPVA